MFKTIIIMKRVLYFAFILIAVSCNNEVMEFEGYKESETTIQAKTRSINEAIEIANNAAQEFFGITRAGGGRIVDVNNVDIITSSLTRSSGNNDTLLYIVNYEDNNGFAVISASRNADALLAVTEQGSYNPDSENVGFNMFMDMAEIYSARTILPPTDDEENTLLPIKEYKETFDTIANITVLPKVEVQWGQGEFEGAYSPNMYSGCSNTAMAQIFSYFCYPTQIEITFQEGNNYFLSLDWDAIKMHNRRHFNYYCSANSYAHNALGLLCRQLGVLNNSIYYDDATSTNYENVHSTFSSLGYTVSSINDYESSSLTDILNSDKIIFMRGRTYNGETNDYVGHAWVVDGAKKLSVTCSSWTRNLGTYFWELLSQSTSTEEYYHINWGNDGICNGYFNAGVFAPGQAQIYDNTSSGFVNQSNSNYNSDVKYFWVTR